MRIFVSDQIRVIKSGRQDFKVVANDDILPGTVIEVCATLPIESKIAVSLIKNNPVFESKLILDRSELDREYKVLLELGELELEKRLDSGQITQEDYLRILSSRLNINSLLDVKTHAIPLGNGLLYQNSDSPNVIREYDSSTKLCSFRTVQYVYAGQDLTFFS